MVNQGGTRLGGCSGPSTHETYSWLENYLYTAKIAVLGEVVFMQYAPSLTELKLCQAVDRLTGAVE